MDTLEQENGDIWIWRTSAYEGFQRVKETHSGRIPRNPEGDLYHFTSAGGLKGIINSRSIRMTDVRYMNDASELEYADELVNEILEDKQDDAENKIEEKLFRKMKLLFNPFRENFEVYVSCFCERSDIASLWDRYGHYAISLDTSKTVRTEKDFNRPLGRWYEASFRKVIYNRGRQESIISDLINDILKAFRVNHGKSDIEENHLLDSTVNLFSNLVSECLISFKNPAFQEEKEWRMIFLNLIHSEAEIDIETSVKGDYIVPHFDMKLKYTEPEKYELMSEEIKNTKGFVGIKDSSDIVENIGKFPVREIRIGPVRHTEIAKKSVRLEILKNNLEEIEINESDVSLRSEL